MFDYSSNKIQYLKRKPIYLFDLQDEIHLNKIFILDDYYSPEVEDGEYISFLVFYIGRFFVNNIRRDYYFEIMEKSSDFISTIEVNYNTEKHFQLFTVDNEHVKYLTNIKRSASYVYADYNFFKMKTDKILSYNSEFLNKFSKEADLDKMVTKGVYISI